jgi:hypothetical protein
MVVGVYGFLYWHAAWKLESAWPIIAVGLLGKVLGPIGMAWSFSDEWPRRLGLICVFNDLIWWLPFGLFLLRGTSPGRLLVRLSPWICIALHIVALVTMTIVLQPGTLKQPDVALRGTYVAEHPLLWSAGWGLWMFTAMSLVGFYAWWGSQLRAQTAAMIAVLIAALGMVFDLSGEALSVLGLVERPPPIAGSVPVTWDPTAFTNIERTATLLTAGASNALYTLGGLILMLMTPDLPSGVRAAMGVTWLAGLVMSVAAVLNHVGGMTVSTAMLFPLLIGWTAWMGARWRRA